jgi:hypothetical protein
MASPRKSGGKSLVKALKAASSSPRSSDGQFIRIERMAWRARKRQHVSVSGYNMRWLYDKTTASCRWRTCVAQALEIIWEAKKTSGSGSTVARSSFSPRQRNKKMRP